MSAKRLLCIILGVAALFAAAFGGSGGIAVGAIILGFAFAIADSKGQDS